VEEVSVNIPASPEKTEHAGTVESDRTARARIGRVRPGWIIAAALSVVIAMIAVWLHGRVQSQLNRKDLVLIGDFDNTTGEPVFDGALKDALDIELRQSPFLEIVADDRTREALRLMGRSPDERVLLPFARELCERVGAKALISGSIRRLGTSYIVTLQSLTCTDGRTLTREQQEASKKEKVLAAVGSAASRLRRSLGESLSSMQAFNAPIEEVTTRSLDALKAYSLGMDERAKGNEKNAILLFDRAVELDSNFAMAYAQLGSAYSNLGETEQGAHYLQRAYSLRDRLSEPEKAVRRCSLLHDRDGRNR
jgi:tetratricopeptide (TPR) repeat protein